MRSTIITPEVEQTISSIESMTRIDPKRLRAWLERFAQEAYLDPTGTQAQFHFSQAVSSYVKHLKKTDPALLAIFTSMDSFGEEEALHFVEEFKSFLELPLGEINHDTSQLESTVHKAITSHRATRLDSVVLRDIKASNKTLKKFIDTTLSCESDIMPIETRAKAVEAVFADPANLMPQIRKRLCAMSDLTQRLRCIAMDIMASNDPVQRRSLLVEFRRTIVSQVDPFHGIREGLEHYDRRVVITATNRIVRFPHVIAMRDTLRSIIRTALDAPRGGKRRVSLSLQSGFYQPLGATILIAEPTPSRSAEKEMDGAVIMSDLQPVVMKDLTGLEISWMPVRDGIAISIAERKAKTESMNDLADVLGALEEFDGSDDAIPAAADIATAARHPALQNTHESLADALGALGEYTVSRRTLDSLPDVLETITTLPRIELPANATQSLVKTTDPHVAGASTFVRHPTHLSWRPNTPSRASGAGI